MNNVSYDYEIHLLILEKRLASYIVEGGMRVEVEGSILTKQFLLERKVHNKGLGNNGVHPITSLLSSIKYHILHLIKITKTPQKYFE